MTAPVVPPGAALLATIAAAMAAAAATTVAEAQTIAVRGERVYTMAGPPIDGGVVLIENGKITAVGPAAKVRIPDGVRLLRAAVVTPGLVDARATVGLAGFYNQDHDKDELENSAPDQPELRALDAFNPQDPLVEWVRSFGVTTVNTGHAPGELVSGQTMVVKTAGAPVDRAVLREVSAIAVTLSPSSLKGEGKSPGTRAKQSAMLRAELVKAREYLDRLAAAKPDAPVARDLRLEVYGRVLKRELPLLVTAHRAQDIATALRLQREFGFDMILDGGAESYLLADDLARAKVPVFLHPQLGRFAAEMENASRQTAAVLRKAGVPVAFESGYESYVPRTRVVLLEAGYAVAAGLPFDDALAAITTEPARLLGVAGRVGSLAPGKDGDVALYDGDPFEYTTHCIGTVVDGRLVSEAVR